MINSLEKSNIFQIGDSRLKSSLKVHGLCGGCPTMTSKGNSLKRRNKNKKNYKENKKQAYRKNKKLNNNLRMND